MSRLLLLLSIPFVLSAATEANHLPRSLKWSSTTYGPDGPWHAITILIGTPPQSVDLFPGGVAVSNILSQSLCTNGSEECYSSAAGLYDASQSSTSIHGTNGTYVNGSFAGHGYLSLQGSAEYTADTMFVTTGDQPSALLQYQDFAMLVISDGQWTLPDGRGYTIEVGNLALGGPYINRSLTKSNSTLFDGSTLSSVPASEGVTPSNSFGMHIGSVGMGISPSIYLGGYDQSRVLGNVTVQPRGVDSFPIDLLDIGIETAIGSSPFPFASRSGLLAQGNSSIGKSMQVIVEPTSPFLYLPKSTCDAITQLLPVNYDSSLGLYLWDTTSPIYDTILYSPAYLSFTFRLNASLTESMSIKVPFVLLNLTLTAPLVDTPTAYFPCTPYDYGKSTNLPTLGRAFLQAAFIGANWGLNTSGNGSWFLAQAPGPNTSSEAVVMSIGLNDNYIIPSENDWEDSWSNNWDPISDSSGPVPVVGIVVGVVLGLLTVLALVVLCAPASTWCGWRKRRVARKKAEKASRKQVEMTSISDGRQAPWTSDESQGSEADFEPKSLFPELFPEPKSLRLDLDIRQRPVNSLVE
jgi:hypothetical protein